MNNRRSVDLIPPGGGIKFDFRLSTKTRLIMDEHPHLHQSHDNVVKRLKRAEGHLRSIVTMIESGRACVDVVKQLYAVEKRSEERRVGKEGVGTCSFGGSPD